MPSLGSTTTVATSTTTTTTNSPPVVPAWNVSGSWSVTLSGFGGDTPETCTATFEQTNCRNADIVGWVLCDLAGTSQDCAFTLSGLIKGLKQDPPNPGPSDVRAYFAFSGPFTSPADFPWCVSLKTFPNNQGFTGEAIGYSGYDPHYAAVLAAPAVCTTATAYTWQGNFGASFSPAGASN